MRHRQKWRGSGERRNTYRSLRQYLCRTPRIQTPPPHRDTGGRENRGTRNPEGAGRGRGVGWRVEEAEATKRRGGEAEDTGGKGTEEVTARRAEKRQKSQRRKHERHREEGGQNAERHLCNNSPPKKSPERKR